MRKYIKPLELLTYLNDAYIILGYKKLDRITYEFLIEALDRLKQSLRSAQRSY